MSAKSAANSVSAETPQSAELSRQLLKAQEEERGRLSRELHDETGQGLMVLRFYLEMLASETRRTEHKIKIQECLDLLDRTIEGLRRTIARLSPRVLEELGLIAAIRREAQFVIKQSRLQAHLDLPHELGELDHDLEVALYRSVQEALHNIVKHAHARNFFVRFSTSKERIALEIEDDGIGFSPRSSRQKGFGLTGMRERVAALGGSVKVRSQTAKGTCIRISFPTGVHSKNAGKTGGKALAHKTAA